MKPARFAFILHLLLRLLLLSPLLAAACGDRTRLEKDYAAAVEAYRENRIADAVESLRELHADDPDFKQTRLYYGRALYYNRQYDDATRIFEEAHENSPDARFWLAKTLARKPENQADALAHLDALLLNNASHVDAWYLKGEIHEQRKEIDEAIKAYHAAARQSGKLALVHLRLGDLYNVAGLADLARVEFQKARLLAGDDQSLKNMITAAERQRPTGTTPAANPAANPETAPQAPAPGAVAPAAGAAPGAP